MNYKIVFYIVGWVLKFESLFLMLPLIVSVVYREHTQPSYLIVAAVCALLGILLTRKKPVHSVLYSREGYMSVALSWIVISMFGALPFVLTGDIPFYVDALFETISGFTTTGASILPEVESMTHSGLFWRSFTHWIGGMGVFVFMMAILPLVGGSDMNLMRAESPGPSVERLVPHVKDTAKILYEIYLVITLAEIILLCAFGMPVFDSMTITFGTVGTGGFGVRNDSCTSYTSIQQNIITIFMILSGVNYTAYFYLISRKPKEALKMEEVRSYLGIILVSVLIISFNTMKMMGGFFTAMHHAFFQVGSIITTTGYATYDFDIWPELSKMILIILMFIGACASSTGGGIKVSRIVILFKTISKELRMIIHPRAVKKIRMDGHVVTHEVIRSTNVFIAVYFVIFFISVLLVSVDEFDFSTNFTAVAATFNNIGPGMAMVGPTKNFGLYSPFSKIVLMFDMLAGRLELFPMLILLTPASWKRR